MPFKSKHEDTLYELIKKGELDFSDEVWNEVSSQGTFEFILNTAFNVIITLCGFSNVLEKTCNKTFT